MTIKRKSLPAKPAQTPIIEAGPSKRGEVTDVGSAFAQKLERFKAIYDAMPGPAVMVKSTSPGERLKERQEAWNARAVPFRDTDPARLPCGLEAFHEVLKWQPSFGSMLLYGPPRRGKTRTVWKLLERESVNFGVWVAGLDASQFAAEASAAFRDGKEEDFFYRMTRPRILFLDDPGKVRMTERVLEALFTIIERRTSANQPIIATINGTTKDLEEKLRDRWQHDPETVRAVVARIEEWETKILIRKES